MTTITSSRDGGLLSETFVHIGGIGPKTEQRLWLSGVRSWSDLRHDRLMHRPGVAPALERSEEALNEGDLDFFFSALPARERWRAFADFDKRFLAVDIETTGMSIYDQITVIGTEIDGEYRTFIQGVNLEDAAELISQASGLISFNGALFDLPFIARAFPDVKLPAAHVDLRFLSRRVGLAGPLKTVERLAELQRDEDLGDISGYEATVLWSQFEHGDDKALARLVHYNAADTCVLRPLAQLVVSRLREELDSLRRRPLEGDLLFDPDESLPGPPDRVTSRELLRLPQVKAYRRSLRVGRKRYELPARSVQPTITVDTLRARMRDPQARTVGIDLTGSELRPTGWALLEGDTVVTGTLLTDAEILEHTIACRPRLVSIDSPLSLPVGRDCTDDDCECRPVGGITRHCERELKRRGINVYPCLIQSMQALTRRGIRLATALREAGIEVIESYPGAAQDMMRIPRKRASQEQLRAGLTRFGMRGLRPAALLTHDELDAATSAVVGSFYLADLYEAMGNEQEDYLIVPSVGEASPSASFGPVYGTKREQAIGLLIGPGAELAAKSLKMSYSRWEEAELALASDTPVLLTGDYASYWAALEKFGGRVRAAYVDEPGMRIPKRPRFMDLHISANDPQRTRKLRRWINRWRSEQED
jgi:uncharacterized protein YprB with RNaseH-like and TPR domain/predicted nuclease with RNAse H fold